MYIKAAPFYVFYLRFICVWCFLCCALPSKIVNCVYGGACFLYYSYIHRMLCVIRSSFRFFFLILNFSFSRSILFLNTFSRPLLCRTLFVAALCIYAKRKQMRRKKTHTHTECEYGENHVCAMEDRDNALSQAHETQG